MEKTKHKKNTRPLARKSGKSSVTTDKAKDVPIIARDRGKVKFEKETSQQKWARENPQKIIEASRRYRKNHPERAKASVRRWYKLNPEKRKNYLSKNYKKAWCWGVFQSHKRRGKTLSVSLEDLLVMVEDSQFCFYCAVKLEYRRYVGHKINTATLDIIDPRKSHEKQNLRILCDSCNKTKSHRSHNEFLSYCKKNIK